MGVSNYNQALSDFRRYLANGWKDMNGGALARDIEFRFDARAVLREGGTTVEKINLEAADLAEQLNQWAYKTFETEHHHVKYRVVPVS